MEFPQAVFEAMIHCLICTITCHGGKDLFRDNQFIGLSVKPNNQVGSINNLEKKHFIKLVDSIAYVITFFLSTQAMVMALKAYPNEFLLDNKCPVLHDEMVKT